MELMPDADSALGWTFASKHFTPDRGQSSRYWNPVNFNAHVIKDEQLRT